MNKSSILTDDQNKAISVLRSFMNSNDRMFVLHGSAGTGKSFTLTHFINNWCSDLSVSLCGTTNKACRVLSDFAISVNLTVNVCTIHSLMGLVLKQVEDHTVLKQQGVNSIKDYDLVIVDECSMVNIELFYYISKTIDSTNVKIVFVGDSHQLPPVGEQMSIVFTSNLPSIALTEIVRQAQGNPIIGLANDIRDAMGSNRTVDIAMHASVNNGTGLAIRNSDKFPKLFKSAFGSDKYLSDSGLFRVVSWTNREVINYNTIIRPIFFGSTPESDFVKGERLVTCGPISVVVAYKNDNAVIRKIVVPTDTEGTVVDCCRCNHPEYPGSNYEVWSIEFKPFLGDKAYNVYVPTSEGSEVLKRDLNDIAELAKNSREPKLRSMYWSKFWSIKEAFTDLRPIYAYTTHRSQGSSYGTVFVDALDMRRNPNRLEALKCLYVAVTRARKLVIINTSTF